jgi:hypothetical protein
MPKRLFTVKPFTSIDKYVEISGPEYFRLLVDFDDVNHAEVRKQVKKMVALLNAHWEPNAEKVEEKAAKS